MNVKNVAILVTVLMFTAVVIGQALTYYAMPNRYDASADASGSDVTYTVSTNSSVTYTVLAYDDAKEIERLFIYYDEGYAAYGVTHAGLDRFIRQTIAELGVRGFTSEISIVNAVELRDALDDRKDGDAVLVTSGVLPVTVYSDTENKMFKWVEDGGSLYWIGYAIGALYADGKDLFDAASSYQSDIFGADDCILMDAATSTARSADPLSAGLLLNNNNLIYGLNVDAVNDDAGVLVARSLGFEHEGYSSVSLFEKGNGLICVLGGMPGGEERISVTQLISSGVTFLSDLIDSTGGSIVRNTITGTMDISGHSDVGVHIRMGEPSAVYARTFFL
jgi:hypothetical protein